MITEIFVENKQLDITADISSLLTFAIDDVKDFSSRQTTYSKTVVLPGTAKNNAIFGNIFDTGISNNYDPTFPNVGSNFNAAKSAACIVFQDNLQTFKGTLRLLQITIDKGRIEYEAALNGELTSLSVALSSGYLVDLDFSAYDTVYSADNIAASWDNAPGSGVYFPLIDYGTYSALKHDWDIRTFRPALYVKEYIDKMFAAADFRYTSDLFNTSRFKRLVVPHNQKALQKLSSIQCEVFASVPQNQAISNDAPGNFGYDTIFATGFTLTDLGATGFKRVTYTGSDTLIVNLDIKSHGFFSAPSEVSGSIEFFHVRGAVTTRLDHYPLLSTDFPYAYNAHFFHNNFTIQTGDYFYVQVNELSSDIDSFTQTDAVFTISTNAPSLVNVNPGDTIQINDTIPANIKQVDFLVSIVKLFNLYVYESKSDDRLILITPFVDFYTTDAVAAVDWTYKLNRDQVITIAPMSELTSKVYNFNYAPDSDYYNDLYQKRYNQGYGSYIFDSEFEFTSEVNTLQLIFAPTPLVGYIGEEKVYPTIFKRTGTDAAPVEENTDSVIRIMQTKKVSDVASWSILNVAIDLGDYTTYGYAGHLDDPDNPDNDLNFGALAQLFFSLDIGDLSKTQFNIYWSSYMAEITDKDSKLLTAKFYLTPIDIFNLNFATYVYVDGVLFRLNKITDYNVSIPSDCEVQLLKVINTTYSYPIGSRPESERTIDWETDDELEYTPGNAILYL